MENTNDFSNSHCRFCAEIKSTRDIFEIKDLSLNHLNLEYKIYHCLQIQFIDDEKLPKTICASCIDKVNASYEFFEQVQRAQETLRNSFASTDEIKALVKVELNDGDARNGDEELENINSVAASPKEEFMNMSAEFESKFGKQSVYVRSKDRNKMIVICRKQRKGKLKSDGSTPLKNIRICLTKGAQNRFRTEENKRSQRSMLIREIINEWKHYEWHCTDCKANICSVDGLRTHYSEVHNKPPQYMCVECSKVFDVYSNFKRHVRAHKNKNKFCCNVCGRYFHLKKHLERHEETHSKDRKYICAKCGKGFKTSNSLRSHGRAHLPSDVKYKYECDVCHKKLSTKPNLLCHKKLHTGIKEYTCDQCGKSFMQKGNLDQHLITIHSDVTPFNCDQCPKKFKTLSSLKTHLKIHSDVRPHGCDVCGKRFHRKGTLTRHQSVHTDALPFECEYCKKCFRMKTFLKIHLRQHTGEKPYSCLECNHHFTDSSNYIKHMKGRHGINSIAKNPVFSKIHT